MEDQQPICAREPEGEMQQAITQAQAQFLKAAEAFAKAHIECDEMEARNDAVSDSEYETITSAYNTTKAALLQAYRAVLTQPAIKQADALDWLEQRPAYEVSCDSNGEELEWVVHRVVGSPNDREWREVGRGATPRAAISDAMKEQSHD
jgi:hypothetical protein